MHFLSDENDMPVGPAVPNVPEPAPLDKTLQRVKDAVNSNCGSCTAPHCKFYAPRCSDGFCMQCCDRIHMPVEAYKNHYRPWGGTQIGFKPPPKQDNGGTAIAKPTETTYSPLPKHYEPYVPPPTVMEPQELEELPENGVGDWTLAAKETTSHYCAY